MNESYDLAELMIEQAADAVIYSDRSGVIMRWNAAATALFGFTRKDTVGQSLDILIPEKLRAAHWTGFHKAIASGKARLSGRPTVTRAVRKDGRKLYIEMTFALVKDAMENVLGSVAIARDATERVARECVTQEKHST